MLRPRLLTYYGITTIKTHHLKVFVVFVLKWQQNGLKQQLIIAYHVKYASNGITLHVQVFQKSNLMKTVCGLAHSAQQ